MLGDEPVFLWVFAPIWQYRVGNSVAVLFFWSLEELIGRFCADCFGYTGLLDQILSSFVAARVDFVVLDVVRRSGSDYSGFKRWIISEVLSRTPLSPPLRG